tara:strand:- start:611850 stop:611996 length:147 start_codon:yes stop_codon:yes gene_type:complete
MPSYSLSARSAYSLTIAQVILSHKKTAPVGAVYFLRGLRLKKGLTQAA